MKCFAVVTLLAMFLFSPGRMFPQQHPNSIYLELLGHGGAYSINYDRLFSPYMGAKIGFSYFDFIVSAYLIPVSLNFFRGDGNSKLELGAGMTIGVLESFLDSRSLELELFPILVSDIGIDKAHRIIYL
jgi:hypothetical protein